MAMPKKGTRIISIDEDRYRYSGFIACESARGKYGISHKQDEVIIEHADEPAQKIKASVTLEKIFYEYQKKGKKLGIASDFPPYIVRQIILLALENGWTPKAGGGTVDIGCVDEKISFEQLSTEQEKERPSRN